jgi:O-antigen ligase
MRRIAWAILLVFAFTVPWEYSLDLGAPLGNVSRLAGLLLLIFMVPAILQTGQIRKPGLMQWLVVALFLWFCSSCFWTIDAAATLERIRTFAQVMTVVWIVWELAESPEDLRNLMRAYVAGSLVLAALTLVNFASPDAEEQVRFAAEGQDPNDMARFLNLGFPLAALLFRSEQNWWGRGLAVGYLPLGFAAVLLTASRSGFVSALIGLVGCGFLLARAHRREILGGLAAIPASALVVWLIVPRATILRIGTIPEQLMGGDLNQRINIWAAGWRAFVHAPLFGSGAGSFVTASRLARIDTAHNTALALAVEGGLVALALGVGIVASASRSVLMMRGVTRVGLGTALLVGIVSSMTATVEGSRSTWLVLALIAAGGRLAIRAPAEMAIEFEPKIRTTAPSQTAETAV